MSVSHLCKNCGVGRVRPFHFSIDQAIVQCDNADCDSFLDSSPWSCVINQKIIPPEKRQLVVCDSEDYKTWSYSSSESFLDSRSPAVYSSDLCFNLPFQVLTLPKESEVVERTLCDSKYISDSVDRCSTNNCTFLDLLCDIDSGIETQILEKENLSVSNNESDLKCLSTNLDSWMESYKFNDFVNNHKTSNEGDNPNRNIQAPVVDQVLASDEDFFVPQMQSELLTGKQTNSSNYYETQKLDSCVDNNVKSTCKRGQTFCSKQFLSPGASVVDDGSGYNEGMSKIMPTVKEENFKSLLEGNIESTNTSSIAGQNSLRYNFNDIVCEESMLTSLDTFSIITHSADNVSTAESKEETDKQVFNEDSKTEDKSFKIVTDGLHKDAGILGTSKHEPSTLNLNIYENDEDAEETLWGNNPLSLMPNDNTRTTAIPSAVDNCYNGLDISPIGDLADENSSQNICLSTEAVDEGKAYCSEPNKSSLSPKLGNSTFLVHENASNVYKKQPSRGRGRTRGRSRGRGRGRRSHKHNEKYESTCISQLEEKAHLSHQGQRRGRTSKVNEVVPRQTRQRTGTLEVQAPRSAKRPFEASHDTTATSLRRGISSLLQGPSWMIQENSKTGNHNITNLSYRSLLNGSAEDPWSVPEFSLEGLDIEIIVQGIHSKSLKEDSNEGSTSAEGRETAKVKESSTKSDTDNQDAEISAVHSLLTEEDNMRRNGKDKQSNLGKSDIEFGNLSNKKGESMQKGNISSCSDFQNHCSVVLDDTKSNRYCFKNTRSMQEQYRSATALESIGNGNVNQMSEVVTCQISEDHTVKENSELKNFSKSENEIKGSDNLLDTLSKAGEGNIETGVSESNVGVLNCNSQKDMFSKPTCVSNVCPKSMLIEESLMKIEFQEDIRAAIAPDSDTNVSDVTKGKHIKSCERSMDIFKTGIYLDPFKTKGPDFIDRNKQRTQEYDDSHKELIDASIPFGYIHRKSELMPNMEDTTDSADLLPPNVGLPNASPHYWLVLPENDEIRTWLGCKGENMSEGLVNISDTKSCKSGTTTEDHLNGPCEGTSSTYFSTLLEGLSFDETFFQCPSNEHPENTFVEHISSSLFFGETADKCSETKPYLSFLGENQGGKYGKSGEIIIDSISDSNTMKSNIEAINTSVHNIGISSKEVPVSTKLENKLFSKNIACTLEGNVKIPCKINVNELGVEHSISNENQSNNVVKLPSLSPHIAERMKVNVSELGSDFCPSVEDESIEIKEKRMRFTTEDQEFFKRSDLRIDKCKNLSLKPNFVNFTKTEDGNTNTNNVSIKSNMFLCIQEKKMSEESNDNIPIVTLDSDNDIQIIVPEKKAKKEKDNDSHYYDMTKCKGSLEDASFDSSSRDQISEELANDSQGDSFLTCGIFDNSVPHDEKCYSPKLKVFVDFEDNYRDIIPRKIKPYYSKRTSQDICKNLNISFNHSDNSDTLDNASCLTVPVLSPSDVSHTDIITASPGFGCTKFSPQHGIVESVRNKEMSSLDEFPSLFLSDEIACEEPSSSSSYSSEYLRNVELQKSDPCSVSYTDLDLCNRYKGSGKKDHENYQPVRDNNTQNQTSTLTERIEQSGVLERDDEYLRTDISSRGTCFGKDALVCVPSKTNSLDIPVVPVIPINKAVKNRITELSLASEVSNTFPLNSAIGVKSNDIVHQNILTEDSTNQSNESHNYTVAKVSSNLLSAPVSIPVTQVVDFTEKVNILCKPNMFMGVSGKNAHIDYKMPLKEQRPVLIPPALATSYDNNLYLEKENVSNSHVTHKQSLESIVAVTTHTSSGPVTRLLRVNTLSQEEISEDDHCVKEVNLDGCSIDKYLMKKEEKMEDDLGTDLSQVKLDDQNSDGHSEEKKNNDPMNSMIKKVRMGSKGGFYLRPSPALMDAIAELRSKKNFDTESKTNMDKSDIIKLPDGTPIAHPIYLQSKNALKKQTHKRKYEGIQYCTDQLVKGKVLETMERSRTDKDIPEMVAVCVHGKLHIYYRNDMN